MCMYVSRLFFYLIFLKLTIDQIVKRMTIFIKSESIFFLQGPGRVLGLK